MNELAPVQMSSFPQGGVAVVFGASGGVGGAWFGKVFAILAIGLRAQHRITAMLIL